MALRTRREGRQVRKTRIRKKILGMESCPRISVFRSHKHIYGQIVDDVSGRTLASASSVSKDFRGSGAKGSTVEGAKRVGEMLAKLAREKDIQSVCFDRGGYRFHGRVKALADGARAAGLKF